MRRSTDKLTAQRPVSDILERHAQTMSLCCALDCCYPTVDDAELDRSARVEEEVLSPPTFAKECRTLEQVNHSLTEDSTRLSVYYDHGVADVVEMKKIIERVQELEGLVDIRIRVDSFSWNNEVSLAALIAEKHTLRSVAICAPCPLPGFLRPYASALSLQTNLEYLQIKCPGLLCEWGSLLASGQWQRLRHLSLELVEGDLVDSALWQLPALEALILDCREFTGFFNLKHFGSLTGVTITTARRVTISAGGSIKRLALYGDVWVQDYLPQLAILFMTDHPNLELFVRHQKTVRELVIWGTAGRPHIHLDSITLDGSVLRFLFLVRISVDTLHWTSETPLKALSLMNVIFKDTPVLRATSISLESSDAKFFRAFYENPALLIGTTRLGLDCNDPSLPLDAIERIIETISETLVFFATTSLFASLPKLPRLKYLGLGSYADVLIAKPSIEKAGKLQILAVFDPEDSLDEAVRSLLPKLCRTLTVPKVRVPVVEGCAVDAKSFFTPKLFLLECLDFRPEIMRR